MKKYLSVFSVIARESMVRISFLWVISAVLQTVIFYSNMFAEVWIRKFLSDAFSVYSDDEICIPYIFSFTILVTGIILMKTGLEFRTKTGYTLRRLRISEKQVFVIHAVYNSLMIFMLFVFEAALCFFLSRWGTTFIEEEYITNQTIYLTFYISAFLQNIFAGRNVVTIIRNILIMIALGFNLSAFSYLWRRGKKYVFGVLVLFASVFLFWISPDFNYAQNIPIAVTAVGTLLIAVGAVQKRGKEYDT